MAVSFVYAKRLAKLGTKLLIPLLVIDTAWSLIHYLIFHTTFNGTIDARYETFKLIEGIITNLLFTSFFIVLTIGMFILALYYQKQSKLGIITSVLLISFIGIKIVFIVFRFIQLIGSYSEDYKSNTFYLFELITSIFLIFALILYDVFQTQLKKRANIGYGRSPFPYLFSFFALSYPIANILSLAGIDYLNINAAFTILRTLAFTASILEIIVYFDLLRRFDFMQSLDEIPEKETTTEEK